MMSKAIDAPSSFKFHSDHCPPKKYLAITLLVIAIVCVAAALLFHFQFKTFGYAIGFGSGALISLIASGYFAKPAQLETQKDDQIESQQKNRIPFEIVELDRNNGYARRSEIMQNFVDNCVNDPDFTNDAKWNVRYQIAEYYWIKFGECFNVLIPQNHKRWEVFEQILSFGIDREDTMNGTRPSYFVGLRNGDYKRAKDLLKRIQPDETILIRSLKICQTQLKARNGVLGPFENEWMELLNEYVKVVGKSKKGAEFIMQNKLPDNLRKILSP